MKPVVHSLVVLISLLSPTVAGASGASSCSAKCTGCSGPSPSCSTGSLCESTHCQTGQCGGLHVGCCCSSGTGTFLCVDVSCGSGKLDPQEPAGRTSGESSGWAVVEYSVDSEGRVVDPPWSPFASSSSHAAAVVSQGHSEGERVLEPTGTYFRLVLDTAPVQPGPSADLRWLADRLSVLGLDEQAAVRFAIRIVDGQIEVLFSTDSGLSDSAIAAFRGELVRRPLEGVYLVEIVGGKVGIVHGL